ncbi:MAG: hypothetical protein JWQ10_1575 [Herbaspirillum sp.]|nr:hypothetical protein [Herbaspirillum sp.]
MNFAYGGDPSFDTAHGLLRTVGKARCATQDERGFGENFKEKP